MEADEGRRPVRGKGEQRIKLKPIFVWKQYNIEPGIINNLVSECEADACSGILIFPGAATLITASQNCTDSGHCPEGRTSLQEVALAGPN